MITSHAPKRLLVIDDEEGPRLSLEMIFEDEFEVTMASDGPEALALLSDREFAVAITDLRMPKMSGIDVLQQIKQQSPNTEVIVITAFESLETAQQSIALGVSDYVQKPFNCEHIRNAVTRCYDNYTRKMQELAV